ncbi:MAG: hypothetical protein JWO36_3479, partial [Myxococcales bacterium]|nr:hypothetical protein [Myxococcales bacterium]
RAAQFAEARPLYEDLVELSPTDASHRLNLGLVYLKLGDSDRAIASLEASRALDPSQGRAVSYLGLAYARAGRYAEAYRSFLLAGQNDLATEIEQNLTTAERDGIHQQLARTGVEPTTVPRTTTPAMPGTLTPPAMPRTVTPPAIARTATPPAISRTATPRAKPPSAPPKAKSRTATGEFQAVTPVEDRAPSQGRIEIPLQSSPAIVIDRPPVFSSASISLDPSAVDHSSLDKAGVPAAEMPRMSDSLQFVLPQRDAVPEQPLDGHTMISRAVAAASPAAAGAATKVAAGAAGPLPLSQLATDELVRPDEGDTPFEVSGNGALVIRVTERVLTRLDGVHITGGDLTYEPATRRSRGHQTEERFDYGGTSLHVVSGTGYLIAVPGSRVFTAVTLDDDIFYLREDLVYAFQATLRWENGNVPGLRGRLPVVQFRGDGAVALRSEKPLVRVKLVAQGVIFVDATRLAGWIGRVIPRAVVPPRGGPMGEVCVECTGEGIVLVDPIGDPGQGRPMAELKGADRTARISVPPPPPAAPVTSPSGDSAASQAPAEIQFNLDDADDDGRNEF